MSPVTLGVEKVMYLGYLKVIGLDVNIFKGEGKAKVKSIILISILVVLSCEEVK